MPAGAHMPLVRRCVAIVVCSGLLQPAAPSAQDEPSAVAGFSLKQALLDDLGQLQAKLVALAEAMPAESYGWRPAEGVRSVGEVFLHVCTANRFFLGRAGWDLDGGPDALAGAPDKRAVVGALERSLATVRAFIDDMTQEEMDGEVDLFGRSQPKGAVLFILQGHLHEHLGQAIAYARVNGIAPPWSRPGIREEG